MALWRRFDLYLLILTLLLVGFGLAMIHSTTVGRPLLPPSQDPLTARQAAYALLGLAVLLFLAFLDYRGWAELQIPLYLVNVALLILVLVAGRVEFGARRWILVGPIRFQPSEAAKILLALTLAAHLRSRRRIQEHPWRTFLTSGLHAAPIFLLIAIEPDLGTAMGIPVLWYAALWAAGLPWRLLVLPILGAIPAAFVGWQFLLPYQRTRILVFLNPNLDPWGSGYNIRQAWISLASGGLLGQGYGFGIQSRLDFLPVRHADFIFAATGEEFGFLGTAGVLLAFVLLLWRALQVAERAADAYGRILAVELFALLAFQMAVNVGMNLGLAPVTGLPLPFLSYGGSALLSALAAVGLLESVWIHRDRGPFAPARDE